MIGPHTVACWPAGARAAIGGLDPESVNSPSHTARIIGRASHRFERWPVTGIAIGEEAWNGLLGLDPM